MFVFLIWIFFGFLSLGILGLNYVYSRRMARKSWNIKKDDSYRPRLSIIVPTYNEQEVIAFKLKNLVRLEYPRDSMEFIFIDSKSEDSTADHINRFIREYPDINATLVVEQERRGKTFALDAALKHCTGDVLIVSDADCFLPRGVLSGVLPYLGDPTVGGLSGPKRLLNYDGSSAARSEDRYLSAMNLIKLGESKQSSTLLFEGGFSAYRRTVLDSFDPKRTGSDDCGTVVGLLEKGFRAIMAPEAEFFTTFPKSWRGKMEIKTRRANQLLRVLKAYLDLMINDRIRIGKTIVAKNLANYFLAPIAFVFFIISTIIMFVRLPLTILLLLFFLVPKLGEYLVEATLNYFVLLWAMFSILAKRRFLFWKQPVDRTVLREDMLAKRGLI